MLGFGAILAAHQGTISVALRFGADRRLFTASAMISSSVTIANLEPKLSNQRLATPHRHHRVLHHGSK